MQQIFPQGLLLHLAATIMQLLHATTARTVQIIMTTLVLQSSQLVCSHLRGEPAPTGAIHQR